ncbi:MAG: hypothetical protein AAF557_04770 [Pseudomonadota bacterium]
MLTKRDLMYGSAAVIGTVLIYELWDDQQSGPEESRAEHNSGFSVAVPEEFQVRHPGGALILSHPWANKWIEVQAGGSASGFQSWSTHLGPTRQTPAGSVPYRVQQNKDAPNIWELTAGLLYGRHTIFFKASEESRDTQPGFAFAWQVIGSVRT